MTMSRLLRRALLGAAGLWFSAFSPAFSQILTSTGGFSMMSYALDDGGGVSTGTNFTNVSALADLAQTTVSAGGFVARVGLMGIYFYPGRINSFTVSPVNAQGQVTFTMTAVGDDAYAPGTSAHSYIIKYSTIAADAPSASTTAFAAAATLPGTFPSPAVEGSSQSFVVSVPIQGDSYFFAITAQEADGLWMPISGGAQTQLAPLQPIQVAISTAAGPPITVAFSWGPVEYFAAGQPFANPSAPLPTELSGYRVYRATSPAGAPWTDITSTCTAGTAALISTNTLQCVDPVAGNLSSYYEVVAVNQNGSSVPSIIRSAATGDGWIVAVDGVSTMDIPASAMAGVMDYAFQTVENTQQTNGGVGIYKAMEFDPDHVTLPAVTNGVSLDTHLTLTAVATMNLYYQVTTSTTGSVVPSSLQPLDSPQNLAAFWNNGGAVNGGWTPLYGTVVAAADYVTLQAEGFGQYQLRGVTRPTSVSFNPGSDISNKEITPFGNNDRYVCFRVTLPSGSSSFSGKIFDIRGGFVSSMDTAGPGADFSGSMPCNSAEVTYGLLRWDAKSHGTVVSGGVYLYEISAGGQTWTGTVVVIR